jgi:hypothetical protein
MEEGSLKSLAQHSTPVSFHCRAGFSQETSELRRFSTDFSPEAIEGDAQGC